MSRAGCILFVLLTVACDPRNQLGPPRCHSTFSFAPQLGPRQYHAHQIDYRIERQRCDASQRGDHVAVEKVVEVTHPSSSTKPPGPGWSSLRIDLLWSIAGRWSRIPLDSVEYPSDSGYASSPLPAQMAHRTFDVAERGRRVAVVELPSPAKPSPAHGWIVEKNGERAVVTEVGDAGSAEALLTRP